MRKVVKCTITALALVGAWKTASWVCAGVAWLLVNRGRWEPAEAADASPWILFALVGGLAMVLYGMYEESRQCKHRSPYGRVRHNECWSDSNRKVG